MKRRIFSFLIVFFLPLTVDDERNKLDFKYLLHNNEKHYGAAYISCHEWDDETFHGDVTYDFLFFEKILFDKNKQGIQTV